MVGMIWGDLPQVVIRQGPAASAEKKVSSVNTSRVLQEIGKNPIAIDTGIMTRMKLKSSFQGFDPQAISPDELANIGKSLYGLGLIDKFTAGLLANVGVEFDRYGVRKNTDQKIDALEYFATQIDHLTKGGTGAKSYAKFVLPDYIRAVHILQNLQDFATKGSVYKSKGVLESEQQEAVNPDTV